FTGDATAFQRFFINTTELFFHQAVVIAELLLLDQPQAVIGVLAARLRAMDAGTVVAAFKIFCRAEDRNSEPAADANTGTCITSHKSVISDGLNAAFFAWATAIVRDGCHVLDRADLQTDRLERTNGGFTT